MLLAEKILDSLPDFKPFGKASYSTIKSVYFSHLDYREPEKKTKVFSGSPFEEDF